MMTLVLLKSTDPASEKILHYSFKVSTVVQNRKSFLAEYLSEFNEEVDYLEAIFLRHQAYIQDLRNLYRLDIADQQYIYQIVTKMRPFIGRETPEFEEWMNVMSRRDKINSFRALKKG
ncbi:hypothetical protein D770_05355 [Flammeovirgaceae bacterium 311]|nr:hypothetical protein D770_05355 [Flammeovirgaceae bacterium 311]